MIFLFFHWIFLKKKHYSLRGERNIESKGVWFYAIVSIFLALIVWLSLERNPLLSFGAVIGSTAFFIVHGFRQNAELQEKKMIGAGFPISASSFISK